MNSTKTMPDRFIVVDDDPANNIICKFIIRRIINETQIQLFSDPEMALATIRAEQENDLTKTTTLLFLDINMPAMSGWDFLDVFKTFTTSKQQQFTIYMLSSSVNEHDKQKASSNPFIAGFISKPLTNEVLHDIVHQKNSAATH